MHLWLENFIVESNKIEGISTMSPMDYDAHADFIALPKIELDDLKRFVARIAPGKPLRDRVGMDVQVGRHVPLAGGAGIIIGLQVILAEANEHHDHIHEVHVAYERIHPFMDGNGRSGRALWLWMMLKAGRLNEIKRRGFLHNFYYQTLVANDARKS